MFVELSERIEERLGLESTRRKISEEEVQAAKKICQLYDAHVAPLCLEDAPGEDAPLKKRTEYWWGKMASAALRLYIYRDLLEKARAIPELRSLIESAENLEKIRGRESRGPDETF